MAFQDGILCHGLPPETDDPVVAKCFGPDPGFEGEYLLAGYDRVRTWLHRDRPMVRWAPLTEVMQAYAAEQVERAQLRVLTAAAEEVTMCGRGIDVADAVRRACQSAESDAVSAPVEPEGAEGCSGGGTEEDPSRPAWEDQGHGIYRARVPPRPSPGIFHVALPGGFRDGARSVSVWDDGDGQITAMRRAAEPAQGPPEPPEGRE